MVLWCSVLLMCLMLACKNVGNYPSQLLQIDQLIVHHPDSALYMLNLLDDFIPNQPEEIQMYHSLLKAKAKEECHEPHTSDSLMKQVVKYYQKKGPAEKLMEAYFLLACAYRDLNDAPYALEYYQKATDVRTEYPHHLLKSKAYSQMGILFTYQGMHFEATEVYRKACFHAQWECDSLDIAEHYRKLARNFAVRNKKDSTIHYYELAGRYDARGSIHERVEVYIRQEEFDKARRILNENRESYSGWGDFYHGTNKRDSASIYYQQALNDESVTLMQQLNIYRRLALYAEERGRIMQALVYTKKVNDLMDSLSKNHNVETEDRMRALYTRQYEAKSERESLVQEKRRYENAFLWKVSIVLLVGLIVGRVYRHQKKSNSSSSPFVVFPELPICQLIKTHAKNPDFKLNDRQWEELSIEMDIAFNAFASRLLELCPKISDVERHVSYLVKLKISPKNIAHIVVRQKNTISSIRERLYQKIHGVEGTPKQFDDFIENF